MNGVNLIPAYRRDAARKRLRIRHWIVGDGAIALALIAICILVQSGRGDAAASAAALSAAAKQTVTLQANVEAARADLANAVAARDTLVTLADPPNWSYLLAGLSATVGDETILRMVRVSPRAQATTLASQPKTFVLTLRGICRSQIAVTNFVQRLQKSGLFTTTQLLRTGREPYQNVSAISFDVECVIGVAEPVPNAPAAKK